jgi:hypothetical protein
MPSFADTGRSGASPRELWKLLCDPSRVTDWWAGDLPAPPRVVPTPHGNRVVIFCQASGLRYEWRLEPDGEGTRIDVVVDIPEGQAFRLDEERELTHRSLLRLAEQPAVAPL